MEGRNWNYLHYINVGRMFENSNKMCVGWWKEWWKSTSPWHMYLYCCFCFSFRDIWNVVIALLGLPVTNQKVLENNSSSYSRLVFIKQFEILKPFNPNLIWLGKPEQTKTWMQKKIEQYWDLPTDIMKWLNRRAENHHSEIKQCNQGTCSCTAETMF